jgi:hypothetical protein
MMKITSLRWRFGGKKAARTLCFSLAVWVMIGSSLRAELTPNGLFTDNAVLQRDMAMPVWGTATAGAMVSERCYPLLFPFSLISNLIREQTILVFVVSKNIFL